MQHTPPGSRPLRADARRNREQILLAARNVFVEYGAGAPLEEIARRAGTGIATLYRRFPDRAALMRAVVLDAYERTTAEARAARDEEPDPFRALERYMHRALDTRIAAVISALLGQLAFGDEELLAGSLAASEPVEQLINAAHAAGALRPEVAFGDIGTMIVRLSRPLPGSFSREANDRLSHRHLDLLINGIRADGKPLSLEGAGLTLQDLRAMRPEVPTDGAEDA